MKLYKYITTIILCAASANAIADWHGGKILQLNVGYDGKTITFVLEGWVRNDCTCYRTWPNTMCLDITRESFAFERAMVLAARARNSVINANINESTCLIQAVYESN